MCYPFDVKRSFPLLAVLVLSLTSPAPAAPPPPSAPAGQGGVVLSGFRLLQDQPGGERWEIKAKGASYDGDKAVDLTAVEARITGTGVEELTVRGERGRYLTGSKLLTLAGKVQAVTRMGYEFSADRLEWKGDQPLVKATGAVRLARDPFSVRGSLLTYNTRTGTTSMTEGVRGSWMGR